jgi:predicted AAA+ superfamily ATPase
MVPRPRLQDEVRRALARSRAVALVGPRQSGKTTLARQWLSEGHPNYFDLENPLAAARLAEPMTALAALEGLIVIDEVQRAPGLFPVLRVLIDRSPRAGQFLLLGSATPALLRQAGESLMGRLEVVEVGGFDLEETGADAQDALWLRGGYPRAFLADTDADAHAWCLSAINRLLESDLPQYGINAPAPAMLRFWTMLAHVHGQVWNAADPARSLGVSEPTVRRYLDHLTQTYMVRQLQPWHENLAKRQVKAPKIYFRDSGFLHALLGLRSLPELLAHPRCGASWEGFAIEQILRIARPDAACFWATHAGAELDLLLFRGGKRVGVEIKRADVPRFTPSMKAALQDLRLDALYVVYPGRHRFALAQGVEAVPLAALAPAAQGP